MGKLPFRKWYPGDWIADTMILSAEARGCWISLLNLMWDAKEKGVWAGTYEEFGRVTGSHREAAPRLIQELEKVADVNFQDKKVTLMCRRIVREETAYQNKLNRQKEYIERRKKDANVTHQTLDVRSKKLEVKTKSTSTSIAAGAAKPYHLPDPKTEPAKCLVLSYKTRKGVQFDLRAWDNVNFARSIKAAQTLIALCGSLTEAESCLVALSQDFDAKSLSWTLETIARNAQEWLRKEGKLNADTSRAGLRLAITQRRAAEPSQKSVDETTEGTLSPAVRDGQNPET